MEYNIKNLIKTTCQAMIAIAKDADDVVMVPFDNSSNTMCEILADQLEKLGVHEPHVEWFFEMDFSEESCKSWMQLCLENPGPEA